MQARHVEADGSAVGFFMMQCRDPASPCPFLRIDFQFAAAITGAVLRAGRNSLPAVSGPPPGARERFPDTARKGQQTR